MGCFYIFLFERPTREIQNTKHLKKFRKGCPWFPTNFKWKC